MSDALAYVKEQVEKFSLSEQIQLLNFIANNINKKTSILINEYSYVTTVNNFSRIIVAPQFEQDNLSLANYDKIIFLFRPYDDGIISFLNKKTKAKVFIPSAAPTFPDLSVERNVFTAYYDAIKRQSGNTFKNFTALFKRIKRDFAECDYAQLVFCAVVFEEVGIISIEREPLVITVNKVKADLNNSHLYARVKEEKDRA